MLEELSSRELAEWEAFYTLEPWGAVVDDHRCGVLAATVANYSGRLKSPIKPSEFFPPRNEKPVSLAEKARALFRGLAGRKVTSG